MADDTRRLTEKERREYLTNYMGQPAVKTKRESKRYGKTLRKAVPRDVLASWCPLPSRPSASDLIFSQDEMRVQELVPLRHQRMSENPFAFYRGAALVMASDLSTLPTTGIEVMASGDAHIANFGLFLTPERRQVFDLNDFDECSRGPWEWDVARLVASLEICGRYRGFKPKQRTEAVLACARGYREAMRLFAERGNLEVWYGHLDIEGAKEALAAAATKEQQEKAKRLLDKSRRKNSSFAVTKLTEVKDGKVRIVSREPEIVPLRDMVEEMTKVSLENLDMTRVVAAALTTYRKTLSPELQHLLGLYQGVDIARKVVGVGSVGTRTWICVLRGADEGDSLVLQVKEAGESVLERFCGKGPQKNHGQRVVEGQHAMQTASDIFLGWCSLPDAKGIKHDYYVRQLWDGKGSVNLEAIDADTLRKIAKAAGAVLAHAHARTGDRFAIASYLGKSDIFDQACCAFANKYADQNERDYKEFLDRIAQEKYEEQVSMKDEELTNLARTIELDAHHLGININIPVPKEDTSSDGDASAEKAEAAEAVALAVAHAGEAELTAAGAYAEAVADTLVEAELEAADVAQELESDEEDMLEEIEMQEV